jgi:hypothetical protein
MLTLPPTETEISVEHYQELKWIWFDFATPGNSTYKDINFSEIVNLASLNLRDFLLKLGSVKYQAATQHSRWKLNKPFQGNIELVRIARPAIDKLGLTNVPHQIVHHSPSGMGWGDQSQSARYELALNAINPFFTGSNVIDVKTIGTYKEFADQFLKQDFNYRIILQKEIEEWLKSKGCPPTRQW